MFQGHYAALVLAYLVALSGWLLANRIWPGLWPQSPAPAFERPWREVLFVLLGGAGVVAVGQLWARGIRLPETCALCPLAGSVNQVLIFAPLLLVLVVRRQPWKTAWLPQPQLPRRLAVGMVLSVLAVTAYSAARVGAAKPLDILGSIWRYENLDEMTQVFLEDVAIAILFVRLTAALGTTWVTLVVAILFAAGHIPTMVSNGASALELSGLLRDVGLGVLGLMVLRRAQDVVWFWCIHFSLDMTQFARISGVG